MKDRIELLKDKAAIYLEEIGISGDMMVPCDLSENKGWGSMYLHDIIAGFVEEYLNGKEDNPKEAR